MLRRKRPLTGSVLAVLAVACSGEGNGSDPVEERAPEPPEESVSLAPLSDTSGFVVAGETRIHYTALGEGSPVLIIHGGPGLDQAYMRPWLDRIGDFARAVYYDQRGTGRSTGPMTTEEINFDDFVLDVDRVREAMGYESVTVLGHSWGGILALAYARAHPDKVDGLILLSTAEPGTQFAAQTQLNSREARSEEELARMQEIQASEAFAAGEPSAVSEIFKIAFRGTLADPSDLAKLNLELAESTAGNQQAVTGLLQQTMIQPEWWSELSGMEVETLILHGRHDPLPVEMAQALGDSIPGATTVVLRDSGHFPFAEEPERVLEEIRSFVAR